MIDERPQKRNQTSFGHIIRELLTQRQLRFKISRTNKPANKQTKKERRTKEREKADGTMDERPGRDGGKTTQEKIKHHSVISFAIC